MLALDLGTRGWRVALVERESEPPRLARPEILWAATVRALERYGIAEAVRSTASVQLDGIDIGGDTPWLTIARDDFAAAGVEAFSANPSSARAIIIDAAAATGKVEIYRGASVNDLLLDDNVDKGRVIGVRASRGETMLTLEATVVVGDDGGNSFVRRHLGIPITLEAFPIEFVTATIARWPLAPKRVRVWIQRKEIRDGLPVAGFFPWPGSEGVVLIPLPANRAQRLFDQPPEVFWSALERVTPVTAALRDQLAFPHDFRRVARPFGHAPSYVANGAALIGDAAHPMTPAGGQGANASIWDALALAEVLNHALRTGVSRESLLPYERLRRPINEKSVSFSRLARRAFRVGGFLPFGFIFPGVLRTINALTWPKRRIIGSFGTTFVHDVSSAGDDLC